MGITRRRRLYLVQEILWEALGEVWEPIWSFDDEMDWGVDQVMFRCLDPAQGRPVKLFADKRRAEHFMVECEAKARQERNPFRHGEELEDLTGMPPGVFHDWLLDAGITSPAVTPFDPTARFAWWEDQELT
jgi:hypothetical protein